MPDHSKFASMLPVTLVLGASANETRFANMALRRLVAHQHSVIALGKRSAMIGEIPVITSWPDTPVDTVTIYLSPMNLMSWHEEILAAAPRRVIFNPGAEAPEFAGVLDAAGVEVVEACTLVMLASNTF